MRVAALCQTPRPAPLPSLPISRLFSGRVAGRWRARKSSDKTARPLDDDRAPPHCLPAQRRTVTVPVSPFRESRGRFDPSRKERKPLRGDVASHRRQRPPPRRPAGAASRLVHGNGLMPTRLQEASRRRGVAAQGLGPGRLSGDISGLWTQARGSSPRSSPRSSPLQHKAPRRPAGALLPRGWIVAGLRGRAGRAQPRRRKGSGYGGGGAGAPHRSAGPRGPRGGVGEGCAGCAAGGRALAGLAALPGPAAEARAARPSANLLAPRPRGLADPVGRTECSEATH